MHADELLASLLDRYRDQLLESVAAKLFRPRIGQPREELIERILSTYSNPPAADRTIKSLPRPGKQFLAALGRSWKCRWTVGDLMAVSAGLGETNGFDAIQELLDRGLLIAIDDQPEPGIASFTDWFGQRGAASEVMLPAAIRIRALGMPLVLDGDTSTPAIGSTAAAVDGLDWPLRLAAARQIVSTMPVKLTTSGAVYKRDYARFTTDTVINAPLAEHPAPPDAGLLALEWAWHADLLAHTGDLCAVAWPKWWSAARPVEFAGEMLAAFLSVRSWDPINGVTEGVQPTGTTTLLLLCLLAQNEDRWHSASRLAAWLWEHHPHWAANLADDSRRDGGHDWVQALLQSVLIPLGLVESISANGEVVYRLSPLGAAVLSSQLEGGERAAYPQTMLVQPNAEVLVYRQGLTPALIAELSQFAAWKGIGPACTLELTTASVTMGLEQGLTLAAIMHCLERHSMKLVPANVADLLQRWTARRDRVIVYPSATLVEFSTAEELETAISRGIVDIRLTDRVGLTTSGEPPDYSQLRLIGNRDYEARPATCILAEDDGVTIRVDAAAADLLLDAEIARFAEPVPGVNGEARQYRITPESLRAAVQSGQSPEQLDDWFVARSGEGLPAAARLFLLPSHQSAARAANLMVIETNDEVIAEGILQWPGTAAFVVRRLGPRAFVVDSEQFAAFQERLAGIGIGIGRDG